MGFVPFDLEAALEADTPVVQWEECTCLLCDGRRWSIVVEAPDPTPGNAGLWFAVVQCQDCGLCFTNPRPDLRSIGQFYSEKYHPHRTRARKRLRWWQRLLRRKSTREKMTVSWHGQGRLLDFGCGGGEFLDRMQREGWQVTGIDASAAAVQRVRDHLGLRALAGTLPHPELPEESFDVVTMWHSLEHVHWPLDVLRAAHRLLAPGGKLVVQVPNIDSLPFRWFGQNWFGLDLPRHLTHFAPQTLVQMVERAGFYAGPVRMVRHSDWVRSSARLAARHQDAPPWSRLLRARFVSGVTGWYSCLTGQSDCIQVSALKGDGGGEEGADVVPPAEAPEPPFSSSPWCPPGDRFHNR